MTDLVAQLVAELEDMRGKVIELCQTYGNPLPDASLERTDAAISAAKDGGWVLPEGKRVIVVDDSFDQLIYWVDRTVSKGNANSDIQEAYEAWTGWDTWPLPNPPKEQNT